MTKLCWNLTPVTNVLNHREMKTNVNKPVKDDEITIVKDDEITLVKDDETNPCQG